MPLRKNVGENPCPASSAIALSLLTFERAYSVLGSSGESSVTTFAADAPYMMQDDENRNRFTPAAAATRASRTEAWWLMSYVSEGLRLPIGSLLNAAR